MTTPNTKTPKIKKQSSGRCKTPTIESGNEDSGWCVKPTARQVDRDRESLRASALMPGGITTTSTEKPNADGERKMERLTAFSQQDSPRSKVLRTGSISKCPR